MLNNFHLDIDFDSLISPNKETTFPGVGNNINNCIDYYI